MSENESIHLDLLSQVRRLEELIRESSVRAQKKHQSNPKQSSRLSPRERFLYLVDPGKPIIELSSLAGLGMHDDQALSRFQTEQHQNKKDQNQNTLTLTTDPQAKTVRPQGGSGISALAWVSGVRVVIYVHDYTIKGGAISPMGVQKLLRAQTIALENDLPLITLAESAGANLNYQAELFVEGGRTFANQARLSARGIPQLTIVHGSSTAGGAYIPGLSDLVIMVKDQAKVYLAGPPLVQAATGEKVDHETLGGAMMHAEVTGSAEWVAKDDREAIILARRWIKHLAPKQMYLSPNSIQKPTPITQQAKDHQDQVLTVVPTDFSQSYDPRALLTILADQEELDEFKPHYGKDMVVGLMKCGGYPMAFLCNHGPIQAQGAAKATQWISLACQNAWPLVFFQNTTGFMVGSQAEREGIVKRGSAFIQAVTNATVPKVTFLIGASFGAGHYAMCGRPFDPRFIFSWPNQKLAVMGGKQAGQVMDMIYERAGVDTDQRRHAQAQREKQFELESSSLFATARLWDDGIIDPRQTRPILIELLSIFTEQAQKKQSQTQSLFPLGMHRL